MTSKITDENSKEFLKRALKESYGVDFPKLLLFTFKELKKEYPDKWRSYIFSALHNVEHQVDLKG